MANEFYDFFNQLFYSHEIWGYMGIFIVIGLSLLIVYRIRYSSLFFAPIVAIMGIDYSYRIASDGYFVLHFAILEFAAVLLVIYDFVEHRKD